MAKLTINPITGKLDLIGMTPDEVLAYVKIAGDTMTGMLTISPAGDTALTANKDVVLKAGRKLIFDGA